MNNAHYSLAGVVAEICARAGLPFGGFDTSLLEGTVAGMQLTNEAAAYSQLETLAQAHFFDPVNRGGKLSFIHRGGEPVLEINPDDLIGDSGDESTRRSPAEIVRVLNLNYYDSAGGIDTDKQSSDRSIDTRGEGEENIDTPLVLETEFAARQVAIAHKVMIEEQRGEFDITLPDSYLALTTADIVRFRGQRLRVDEVHLDNGEQRYTLVYDRKSAYQSRAFGIAPVPPPEPTPQAPGPTNLHFIDSAILSSADDAQLGYYIAVGGTNTAWRGASVALSLDGGENYIDSAPVTTATVMGTLETALGNHRNHVPDQINQVQVRLSTPGAALEARTLAQLQNRQNRALIGDEIVAFGAAEELEPGLWQLGYFLRGRLDSPTNAHPPGTRFVLLNRNTLQRVPTERYNLNQALSFRAISFGALNDDSETTTSGILRGQSHIPPAPAYLRAYRHNNQLHIHWIGTGHLGGRAAFDHSQYFSGYRIDINGNTHDTQNTNYTTTDPGPARIRVAQLNTLTGPGPSTEINL